MKNHFDRLSDDLVINILGRLLWDPFRSYAGRAKERIEVEGVCKRFRRAECSAACLEWHCDSESWSELSFVSYLSSRQRSLKKLSRFALLIRGTTCLMSLLLLVIPRALETLTEVHLYFSAGWYESHVTIQAVNWHDVLNLLQACPKLAVLEIHLAESDVHYASYTLNLDKLLNFPFPSLTSLTLYGFCGPSGEFSKFLQVFPSLQYLEMHHERVRTDQAIPANPSASKLEKLFLWGKDTARLDRANPANVDVPRSLGLLVKLLTRGDADDMECIMPRLEYIVLLGGAPRKLLAKMPEALRALLSILGDDTCDYTKSASRILAILARDPEGRRVLGGVPATLEGLISCLESGAIESEDEEDCYEITNVAWVFHSLAEDAKLRKVVGASPDIFPNLASLLAEKESPDTLKEAAAAALGNLARRRKNAKAAAAVPGCLSSLVRALSSKSGGLVKHAVMALRNMSRSPRVCKAIAEVPKAVQELARVVGGECEEDVREAATETLGKLLAPGVRSEA